MLRNRALIAALLFSLLLTMALPAVAQVNQQAIAEVASGKLKQAKASWWGFDATDATRCLQAAIDSKVPKLTVDNVGKPWIVLPITLVSNQEIVFEKGVEVLAKRGEFKGTNDSLFTATLCENVTLSGYGTVFRMWRDDYDKAPYARAEWRHVVSLRSCSNVKLLGLTLAESGGDGIYLGTGKAGVTNLNVTVKDVVCDRNYRQGISVITAENLTIENTVLSNTRGTSPQAGIDFEPNGPAEKVVNCVMRDCSALNNAGGGFVAYVPTLDATSAPFGLKLINCKADGNAGPAAAFITGNAPAAAVKGVLELTNCELRGRKHTGFMLMNNPPTGLRVLLEKCSILETALEAPTVTPILIEANQACTEDVGGIRFVDCLVRDPLGRKPMSFVDMSGSVRVVDVTGNLIIEKDGQKTPFEITEQTLAEWMPILKFRRYPRYDTTGVSFVPVTAQAPTEKYSLAGTRLRQDAHFVLYAKSGDQVSLRFDHGQVGKYAGKTASVVVTGPDGEEVAKLEAPFMQESDATFTARATGLYRLDADVSPNCLGIVKSSHPWSLNGLGKPMHFMASLATLYFCVPAGTKEFGVKVFGEGNGEGVKATLLRPSGEVFAEQDDIAQARQFEVELPEPSTGEVWSLRLARATHLHLEDHYVDLLGIPSLLAPSPESVLAPVK